MQLEYVKAQLKVSEQRLLADSAIIEHLRANVRRLRIAGSWYRQCAFSKLLSGSRPCDASVQTDQVQFGKNQKAQRAGSGIDPQTGAVLSGGGGGAEAGGAGGGGGRWIGAGAAGGGSKTTGDDSGSEDEKQENRYTYVDCRI